MAAVSRDDWTLHRKGQQAQARHKKKVKAAIRENLKDVITNEGLIVQDGRQVIRIPIHSMDEPHFQFNRSKQKHIGQGEADKGQVIGQAGEGKGLADGPGDAPGEHVFEAEVTLDEIEDVLFANFELPNLKPKPKQKTQVIDEEWSDVRRRGIQSNLDRKRTFVEALKRSVREQSAFQISQDDLRFKTYEEKEQPQTGAVIFAMMDISASMGEFEKYIARTFFFWMQRFLNKHYPQVQIRYLVHHTEAADVSAEDFYRLRESGGTKCSSVYELALQLIENEYPADSWNVYPMHVSDGDNMSSDNNTVMGMIETMCEHSSMVGYLEIQSHHYHSSLSRALGALDNPVFRQVRVSSNEGVLSALSQFFRSEDSVEGRQEGIGT